MTVNWDNFLGTIAGNQTTAPFQNGTTYARILDSSVPLAFTVQKLREKISSGGFNPDYYQEIGSEYACGGRTLPGGGYFVSKKIFHERRCLLTSFEYAIENIGQALAELANTPLPDLMAQSQAYGINYFLHRYFQSAEKPEEGDLVVYYDQNYKPTQAGVFRNTTPNWNSPRGGTIESKWSQPNPYAFIHDVFFVPEFFGSRACFYRLKKPGTVIHSPRPLRPIEITEELQPDGSFKAINDREIRQIINSYCGKDLEQKVPQIRYLHDISFFGVCFHYALGKVLKTYSMPNIEGTHEWDLLTINEPKFLKAYFLKTSSPKPGDLAVYSKDDKRTHYGVYIGDNLIESKWGLDGVYQHPPFFVDTSTGDTLTYYRMKSEFTPEQIIPKTNQ